jgi:hypothetical protein
MMYEYRGQRTVCVEDFDGITVVGISVEVDGVRPQPLIHGSFEEDSLVRSYTVGIPETIGLTAVTVSANS